MSTLKTSKQDSTELSHMGLILLAANLHGLDILPDKRLAETPYIAMNPMAGKELKQPYIENTLTYDPKYENTHRLWMDLNHELEEYLKMKSGWHYEAAHKWADRKQRTFIVRHRVKQTGSRKKEARIII